MPSHISEAHGSDCSAALSPICHRTVLSEFHTQNGFVCPYLGIGSSEYLLHIQDHLNETAKKTNIDNTLSGALKRKHSLKYESDAMILNCALTIVS